MAGQKCDVLVVGAGIVGAATAYHLKEQNPGLDILLVDRAGVAQGNTSRSVTMIRDTFTSPVAYSLVSSTIHEFRRMHGDLPGGIDLNRMMYLWLFSKRRFEKLGPDIERIRERGTDMELLSPAKLKEWAPCLETAPADEESVIYELPPIEIGLLCRNCYTVDPIAITQCYVDRFRKAGGRTAFGPEVSNFIRQPERALTIEGETIPGQPFAAQPQVVAGVVLKDGGTIEATTTLLATGAWSRELTDRLGRGSLLSPKKRQWFYLEGEHLAPLFKLPAFGNDDGTIPFTILPPGVYMKPSREGGIYAALSDGLGRPFDLDTRPERDFFVNNIHYILKGYFPAFEHVVVKAMDAGSYCYDEVARLPIIDWLYPGIMLVSGDSGSGIMKADAMGRVAAHRYKLGPACATGRGTRLDLPGGFSTDTDDLTIVHHGRLEPERFVI